MRPPCIHHTTSQPAHFVGRRAELRILDDALQGGAASVVALVGPGGQGKTAIVQHWLEKVIGTLHVPSQAVGTRSVPATLQLDGVFFWSFYRGKDSDLCLRHLWAYANEQSEPPDVSASYCVDHLVPILRRERWAIVLDGAEVVQHEVGPWRGRFLHPELGRLLEEMASEPLPGVLALTTRFVLPDLGQRKHARLVTLGTLDLASAVELAASLGVQGSAEDLGRRLQSFGLHAKAVELLATYLARFAGGDVEQAALLPIAELSDASAEEAQVARVLAAFARALPQETQDILALATAFRQPPTEERFLQYLASAPVRDLLHGKWARNYVPFVERTTGDNVVGTLRVPLSADGTRSVPATLPAGWLAAQIQELIDLRLLERVKTSPGTADAGVLDAHPLVRRGFERVLGQGHAAARAGFLRGRPDRRPPASLDEAREEVELFHAYCDAGLWNEADSAYLALDNPKHRFLAPAFERDLLVRFFPKGDWRQPPLWAGFGRTRSLAICLELMGQFEDALAVYRSSDAALRGDALIALGRLQAFVETPQAPHPWQMLWHCYRAHAYSLLGKTSEALALAQAALPMDIYEWVHLFECLLRLGRLDLLDLESLLYRRPFEKEQRWATLARRRMRADYLRMTKPGVLDFRAEYQELLESYDRGGLPFERTLTRLSMARWLIAESLRSEAGAILLAVRDIARRYGMGILEVDSMEMLAEMGEGSLLAEIQEKRKNLSYFGSVRS
ncbi:MAG: ATP-binding protein [Gemmataceae bacterium]|nr:ATP-binding protein [Gemmataceae bacterium]